jgi:glycogen operon protein
MRRRMRRAMIATLLLAQGTPLLCAGDEFGNGQQGNNNAWCQDNAVGWLDWDSADDEFAAFVAATLALRRDEPALHHDRWFHPPTGAAGERALRWLAPSGHEMQVSDWHDGANHAFACLITQDLQGAPGSPRLLLIFNPESQWQPFVLPPGAWRLALDSGGDLSAGNSLPATGTLRAPPHALAVLRSDAAPPTPAATPPTGAPA